MDIAFPLNIVPVSLICSFIQNEIRNIEVGYGAEFQSNFNWVGTFSFDSSWNHVLLYELTIT